MKAVAVGPRPQTSIRWIPILTYHRVIPTPPVVDRFRLFTSAGMFERQLRWLRAREYTGLSLGDLARALDGESRLPAHSVVITFDDGYQDNRTYAWPILQRYGFPATIFLVADAIGGSSDFDRASGYPAAPMLRVADVHDMLGGLISFGSHSCSHPASLVHVSHDQLADEVRRSKRVIEDIIDGPVEDFSYPHSKVTPRVERAVESAGYRLACAGVGSQFSRYSLSRIEAPGAGPWRLEAAIAQRRLRRTVRAWA